MKSVLTVLVGSPPATQDLTVLQTVKDELGITGTEQDALLAAYIERASGIVSAITGRVYGEEDLSEAFYFSWGEQTDTLKLARRPVSSVASVLENGSALVENTDFIVDGAKGLLYRRNGTIWTYSPDPAVVVEYTAGYQLLGGLPSPIEAATLLLVKSYYFGAALDPTIRSETTNDLDSVTYRDALGAEQVVRDMLLGPFTELVVA